MIEKIPDKKKKAYVLLALATSDCRWALELARKYRVVGFDINRARVELMKKHVDPSKELDSSEFEGCDITFTAEVEDLRPSTFYVVAVPTPINEHKNPDLKPLLGACKNRR
jgi:UDP-N-acetyl-D-galactosamine dehydrogenase